MAKDEKTPDVIPSPRAAPEPIRVERITWTKARELPGPANNMLQVREKQMTVSSRTDYSIEYMPWLRHFCVTHMPDVERNPEQAVRMIHEVHAESWIPKRPG